MSKASSQVSEIDRLIDLASDDQSPRREKAGVVPVSRAVSNGALSLEDQKNPQPSMWRVLLQLRGMLPHLVRLLPLLERGVLGTNVLGGLSGPGPAASPDTSHFDRGIAEIEGAHRDLSLAVKNQTGEVKYLQEQVTWLGKSLERAAGRQEEMAHDLASLRKMMTIGAIVIAVLLTGLVAGVAYLILQHTP